MTAILAILGALAPFLPIALQIAGWAIQFFGASSANLKAYQDMLEKNKDAGNITVETYSKLSDWHKDMKEKADAAAAQKNAGGVVPKS